MREATLLEEVGAMDRLYYNRQRGQVRLAERSDGLQVFRSSADGRWVPFEPEEAVGAPLHYEGVLAFRSASALRTR
jgi:hypothetical protein